MNDQEYRAIPKVSNSGLSRLNKSPLHYQHFCKNEGGEDTPELAFGRLYHVAILEPNRLTELFQGIDPDKRPQREINPKTGNPFTMGTKENSAWYESKKAEAEADGKTLVWKSDWVKVQEMREVVYAHPQALELLNIPGEFESVVEWIDEETGIECKAKRDKLVPGEAVIDLKTTNDASPSEFYKSAFKYGYHRQGKFYCDGSGVSNFRIIAQEKKAPYAVNVFHASESDFMYWGGIEYRALLKQIVRLRQLYGPEHGNKIWPGYGWESHGATELAYPEWLQKRII